MAIADLFSTRQRRLRGEEPEVFVYDQLPPALRVQIIHIWKDALGDTRYDSPVVTVYKRIHDTLCREYGRFQLSELAQDEVAGLRKFVLSETDPEKVLDAIELSFRYIEQIASDPGYRHAARPTIAPDDAITELNARFLEHGVGYEYSDGELLRKDSEFLHHDVVKPALVVLRDPMYRGPNDEFLAAHQHYRHGRYKEAMNECLKAFESTLKVICDAKKWQFEPNATAKTLLEIAFRNGLVPVYLQSEFTALRSTLESGIPTARNKTSGHGQGSVPTTVPQHLVSYVLHLTATSILFLTQSADAV